VKYFEKGGMAYLNDTFYSLYLHLLILIIFIQTVV